MEAARWVVGKALSPASGAVLEAWAASTELGANIRALRMELLYAQGMLNNAHGREHGREEIKNRALTELLQELQDLAYSADDALDEVDYFRIQDELDGTFKAADEHAGGFLRNHASNAGHAVKGIAKSLGFSSCARSASRGDRDEPNEEKRGVPCGAWPCRGVLCGVAWPCAGQTTHQIKSSHPQSNQANQEEVHSGCMQKISSSARNTISIVGKHLPCYSSPVQNDPNSNMASSGRLFFGCARPNKAPQREDSIIAPKLKFNRVEMSKKMKEITKQLKPVCAKVSTILNLELLDSNRSIAQCIATGLDKMINKNQGYYTPLPTNSAATMSRPITTAEPMESTFYGRDNETSKIIHDITKGDYRDKDLTVLPIVGPGGIGKTTLTRHIYKKLEQHFVEKIWVGKLRSLQELKRFVVKKESRGFELSQIGHLELCGSLRIDNLGMVEKEEADEAKLTEKTHLRKLALHWDSDGSNKDPAEEDKVLESLKPSDNLVELCITGHGGATFPSWLGANFSVKNLECLRLEDVSWKNLPPLGELLVDEQDKECYQRYVEGQHFTNLKMLELVKIPKLKKWIGNGPCELFSHLEELTIEDCPELMELPYAHHNGCVPEHEDHMTWFPRLEKLRIARCPKLSSLPCIPWSSSTRSAKIVQVGSGLDSLDYTAYHDFGYLRIGGKDALDDGFWNVVAFRNLPHLPSLSVTRCPPLSLDHLQVLSSLKTLRIYDSGDAVWFPEGDGCVGYQCSAEDVTIEQCGGSGERLTRLFSCFPNLRSLSVGKCEKLTGLGVVDQKKQQQAPAQLSSSIDEVDAAQIGQREQQQGTRGEEEIVAAAAEELLLDRDTGRTGGGGGLQGLRSLRILRIFHCPRFLSSYSSSSSSPCFPFPTSLERLSLADVDGMQTLLLLSNLTSLADLYIWGCRDLRCEGLRHLLVQGRLAKLTVRKTLNFFADFEPSPPHEQELPSSSSKLQELWTDDVASVLAGPICALLSSSLTKLNFLGYKEGERFTKEQEEALQLLTSLERIEFWSCDKLKCLPAGLHRLPNLKILGIDNCAAIRSLPKDGLPSSLQELEICYCPAIRSMPKEYLPNSLQKLVIEYCPAIKSLPKVGDLPSSLRELDVRHSSKELRSQCRKLIGTIPIVRVD
ncbi:unnamed protein product [Urochloa decumbens]|uniref:Uncharacterized protein n=1 Tax=Urochloa decumbens TaxID=240449 RepID=A0ABC9CSM8_9POAL